MFPPPIQVTWLSALAFWHFKRLSIIERNTLYHNLSLIMVIILVIKLFLDALIEGSSEIFWRVDYDYNCLSVILENLAPWKCLSLYFYLILVFRFGILLFFFFRIKNQIPDFTYDTRCDLPQFYLVIVALMLAFLISCSQTAPVLFLSLQTP